MAGIHHANEGKPRTSTPSDQTDGVTESLKDFSISKCSKSQKKGGGKKQKKPIESCVCKTKEKEIQRPLSQASIRSKKYVLPFQKSGDTPLKTTVNRLSSSDPSGDALLRKNIAGDQIRGLRHSSSSSPSQSSETAKFGAYRRKGRRGSDSCPEKGYLLPYGLRVQHAAHKCIWSGSESGSATSPAGSSSQPSVECIGEVAAAKASVTSESRKGSDIHFRGGVQKNQGHKAKKEFKFEAYMPLCEVQQSLKKGELIEGVLRINPRNYEDAYISAPDGQMDIYIGGIHDRNRALNGDVVAVQLKEPKEWKILWDDLRDYQEKHGCEVFNNGDTENDVRKYSTILPHPDIRQEANLSTFEIGVFNVVSNQSEEFTKKKRRKKRNGKRRKQEKHSTDDNKETKLYDTTLDSNEIGSISSKDEFVTCSDTVPKDDKALHYIPSKNVLDINCYSSTSFDNSVLHYNSHHEQKIANETELTVVADCSKEEEIIANGLINKQWTSLEHNHLFIIPDDIPHFESSKASFENDLSSDAVIEEDNQPEKVCSIAVAPDELSGDEFSQSVSGDSSCSHHLDQMQEDKAFFSSELDELNNNEADLYGNEKEQHTAECDILEDEIDIHDSVLQIHRPEINKLSMEVTPCSNNSLENSLTNSLNSTYFIMPHNNVSPSCETEPSITTLKILDDKTTEHSCKTHNASIQPSAVCKELNSDVSQKMEKLNAYDMEKSKSKQKLSLYRKTDENKEKQKLDHITELMNYSWGRKFIQRTAKVVHILEKKHTRMAAGSLKLLQDGNSNWALFSPTDHKLPRIFIPMRDCPSGFLKRSKDFTNYLFLAKIVDWTEDSKFAKGNLIQKLGDIGEIDAETQGILLENGIDTKDFDDDVLNDLPQESNWHIPHDEIKSRRDFREECVFTIDPSTARDLDDAVSCKILDDSTFEIGVHIADVTYFVKDGTVLDSIASERATSVYLVQNVVPMLPHTLCEKLCSLNPGEDRLTFSVVWKMTSEGEIIDEWFGRSIISSCVKLSYEDVQAIIENPQKQWDGNTFPHINGNFGLEDIVERITNLNYIAQKLRQKRFKDGALRLDQVKLQFCLDKESGMPSGFSIYEHRDSNRLIEEFMLLANMAVAHKIYKSFPHQALLRCHPPPEKKLMNDVVTTCEAMGIKLDASTSGTLQASLAALIGDDVYSKARMQILTSLCSKPMKCAQYFSSGMNDSADYHHYALNVPLYTHFTSPIRRYPDIIVHRLLAASLGNIPTNYTSETLQKLANHCNDKKYTAKRVNELSCELFLVVFIRECGPIDEQAMVMGVMDHSFDVLVLSIGLIKRVYCDKLNLKSKRYQKEKGIPQLVLYWNQGDGFTQEIKIFTLVDVTLSVQQGDPMKINAVLRFPGEL